MNLTIMSIILCERVNMKYYEQPYCIKQKTMWEGGQGLENTLAVQGICAGDMD